MPPLENTCSGDSMELKQRKNLRLQSFDYSSAKYYFVTICTKNRARLFGQIVGNGLDRSLQIGRSFRFSQKGRPSSAGTICCIGLFIYFAVFRQGNIIQIFY